MCHFGKKISSWLSIDVLPSFLVSIKTTELECSRCINGMACMLQVLCHYVLLCCNVPVLPLHTVFARIYSIKAFSML